MDKHTILGAISRVALIAGMVVLGVFAFLGVARLVPKAANSLASAGASLKSAFVFPKSSIALSLSNNSVNTGESATVSFDKKNTGGSYVFRYDCDGKNLSMVIFQDSHQTQLSCNATTTISANSFTVVPTLENKNAFVDSNLYIDFIKDGEKTSSLSGKATLTVHNGTLRNVAQAPSSTTTPKTNITPGATSSTATASKEKPATSTPETDRNTTPSKPDLSIIMKDVGVVVNGTFVSRGTSISSEHSFGPYEKPVVRFLISNIGGMPTGPWQFNAILPTNPSQTFPSGVQRSLNPGEVVEYTLTLENLATPRSAGVNTLSIIVDPFGTIDEMSKSNNNASITLLRN